MAPRPILLMHPSSLAHDTGSHPESADRIAAIGNELERRDWCGYQLVASPAVERDVLARVHSEAHIVELAAVSQRGGGSLDADTLMSAGSYQAALHAAGGAVEMVRRLVEGGPGAVAISVHRPPGHHATPTRAMGFCLFNNVAVAAQYALDRLGLRRVMILDWDVHHGNGTQDVFWESDQVLFCSIHQWPLYPGTGRAAEAGEGPGYRYTVNLPVPPGSGDNEFIAMVQEVAIPLARTYRPQLLLLSIGYDAHVQDPLANCNVSDAGFDALAIRARGLATELQIPIGCVLEGGYDTDVLARCTPATMETLAAADAPDTWPGTGGAVHPLARAALEHLRPRWPSAGR